MDARSVALANLERKMQIQKMLRGRPSPQGRPTQKPKTPIEKAPAIPIERPDPLPQLPESIATGADGPIGVQEIEGGEGNVAGREEGRPLEPGEDYAGDPSGDIMGTAGKMSGVAAASIMGPANMARSAYRTAKNLVTGKPQLADIGTAISLGATGGRVYNALDMGVKPGAIAKSMLGSNPMSTAAGMLTTGILSELGFDQSTWGKIGKTLGGLAGSYVGGLPGMMAGQLVGGSLGSAAADLAGKRTDEENREYIEEKMGAGGWKGLTNPVDYVKAQRAYTSWDKQRRAEIANILGGRKTPSKTPLSDILDAGGFELFSKELADIKEATGLDKEDPDAPIELGDWEGDYDPDLELFSEEPIGFDIDKMEQEIEQEYEAREESGGTGYGIEDEGWESGKDFI